MTFERGATLSKQPLPNRCMLCCAGVPLMGCCLPDPRQQSGLQFFEADLRSLLERTLAVPSLLAKLLLHPLERWEADGRVVEKDRVALRIRRASCGQSPLLLHGFLQCINATLQSSAQLPEVLCSGRFASLPLRSFLCEGCANFAAYSGGLLLDNELHCMQELRLGAL